MPRETILTAADSDASAEMGRVDTTRLASEAPRTDLATVDDVALRPKYLRDIIGQRAVCERIQIAVDAAARRKEPLGHVLLHP